MSYKIKNRYNEFLWREKIPKHQKYKESDQDTAKHLTKSKNNKSEKLYDYYCCDYCNDEIKIISKKDEMTGGIVTIPRTLTKKEPIKLVLCNKCLKPVIAEYEEELNK